MYKGIKIVNSIINAVLCTALMIFLPSSCSIDEDLPPCPRGLDLHFVFDYHMEGYHPDVPGSSAPQEYPNVFYPQVHCYTLHVYNQEGELIKSFVETGEKIRSNHYHLQIDLPHGTYKIRAYGGTGCEARSFHPVMKGVNPESQPLAAQVPLRLADLYYEMNYDKSHMTSDQLLHDFYYAYGLDDQPLAEAEVVVEGEMYKPHTLRFMRNTNAIRVLMQQSLSQTDENGQVVDRLIPIHVDDYILRIIDNNTLFDAANHRVTTGQSAHDLVTYYPWTTGNEGGDSQSGQTSGLVATADFSVSRLYADSQGKLQILNRKDQKLLLDMPLSYLQFSKPAQLKQMSAQEYLDRQKYWNVTFIRNAHNVWADATIIINGWTVRINDTDF